MRAVEIIAKKRDGEALSETENPGFDNDTLKMKIINNVGCAYSEINDAKLANQYFFAAVELAKKITTNTI